MEGDFTHTGYEVIEANADSEFLSHGNILRCLEERGIPPLRGGAGRILVNVLRIFQIAGEISHFTNYPGNWVVSEIAWLRQLSSKIPCSAEYFAAKRLFST